ncbi:hypothetical protein RSAG8_11250, partial [Rhizoctonia solani AG-8 WAC10335]
MQSIAFFPKYLLSPRFGEETVDKMLGWTLEKYPADAKPYVLDIGTGNGIMTVTLAENGYDPDRLVGLDYSEPSIKLARSVASGRGYPSIRYIVSDFINETAPEPVEGQSGGKWDLLLDKGTYDAIALSGKSEDATNGDEGEVWFGEETVDKMLDWTLENYPADTNPYVLDIGTGNGIMTVTLAENGYDPDRLVGLDYSEPSIKLARSVASGRGYASIRYIVSDFINEMAPEPVEGQSGGKWDLLLDKGTYDAIALSGKSEDATTIVSRYPPKVAEALKSGGMFLITSCNFTEEELKEAFGAPELELTYHSRIQHPTFKFGGNEGSICSSIAFKKKKQ